MKRLLFLSVLLMSVVICGTAFAAEPNKAFKFINETGDVIDVSIIGELTINYTDRYKKPATKTEPLFFVDVKSEKFPECNMSFKARSLTTQMVDISGGSDFRTSEDYKDPYQLTLLTGESVKLGGTRYLESTCANKVNGIFVQSTAIKPKTSNAYIQTYANETGIIEVIQTRENKQSKYRVRGTPAKNKDCAFEFEGRLQGNEIIGVGVEMKVKAVGSDTLLFEGQKATMGICASEIHGTFKKKK